MPGGALSSVRGVAVIVFYEINHALCGVEQYSVGGLERGLKG